MVYRWNPHRHKHLLYCWVSDDVKQTAPGSARSGGVRRARSRDREGAAARRRCARNRTRIWASPASITIAPSARGFPEVILGLGKTPAQIAAIAAEIVARGSTLLVTRASEAAYEAVRATVPAAVYHADAGLITLRQQDVTPGQGHHHRRRGRHLGPAGRGRGGADRGVDGQRGRPACTTSASPACTGCSASASASTPRASSSSSPAWKARCRASSPAW